MHFFINPGFHFSVKKQFEQNLSHAHTKNQDEMSAFVNAYIDQVVLWDVGSMAYKNKPARTPLFWRWRKS